MADQSSGNNLIPGLHMKNIYERDFDLLKGFGRQVGSAYDQYGKALRSALGQDQDEFTQQFLAGKLLEQREGKNYIVNGVTYDGKTHRPKGAPEGGYSLSPDGKMTAHAVVKEPVITENPAPVYNAQDRVKKHGVKKAEDMAMMEWAKAHKGLAEKVKPGQAGYDAIQLALGKTTVEPEDIRGYMDDSGKSAEEVRAILGGGSVETVIDGDKPMVTTINQPNNQEGSEAFKNFSIGALQGLDIGKYKDLGYNPFQIDAGKLLDQSVDFNIPGLERPLGNYGTADYGELLKKYPNIFSNK